MEIYTDSTSHWKYQTSDFSNLTRTTYTTFSNHRTVTKFNAIARIFSLGNINIHEHTRGRERERERERARVM